MEQHKPSVNFTLEKNKEIIQNVNTHFLKGLIEETQNNFIKENGLAVHKEFIEKLPNIVSLDEILEAKNLKSK